MFQLKDIEKIAPKEKGISKYLKGFFSRAIIYFWDRSNSVNFPDSGRKLVILIAMGKISGKADSGQWQGCRSNINRIFLS